MKISILPSAQDDLVDGYWFYERQATELGSLFIRSILDDIERLEFLAGVHPVHLGKHRMVASTFPYSIFYLLQNQEVNIYAILDDRRDPQWISDRLN
jgi:plasmid stabilization system protein ParE